MYRDNDRARCLWHVVRRHSWGPDERRHDTNEERVRASHLLHEVQVAAQFPKLRREDVSKEEEKITVRNMEDKSFQVEGVQKEKELKKENKKSEVVGWSTEKVEEKQVNTSSKTRKKWCNGGTSIRKEITMCGKRCRKAEKFSMS